MENNHAEIKRLRQEITRLKVRLHELDDSSEPTSVACGHDVALEHLRKLASQHGLTGLCQMTGTEEGHGWYTTNIVPQQLRALLEGGAVVREFLGLFCAPGVWEALTAAFHGESAPGPGTDLLKENSLIQDGKLTVDGFFCYAVLGHLTYNIKKKLAIPKALAIFKLAYAQTKIQYGEHLPYSEAEFVALLQKHPTYPELAAADVTEADIRTYLRQINV